MSNVNLKEVLTITEAAELWGKEVSTLRRVIKNNKFTYEVDYRKSGSTWLITKTAMEKVYGKLEIEMSNELIEIKNKVFEKIIHEDITEIDNVTRQEYFYCIGRSIRILESGSKYKREKINKYLNAKSMEILKKYKRELLKKNMNTFVSLHKRYGPAWNVILLTYANEFEGYDEEDKNILMFGYLDTTPLPKVKK